MQSGANLFLAQTQGRKWLSYQWRFLIFFLSPSTQKILIFHKENKDLRENSRNVLKQIKQLVFSVAYLREVKSSTGINWLISDSWVSLFLFCFILFCFLSGLASCGILVPWPGIEPVPPAVEAQSPPLDCQGTPSWVFKKSLGASLVAQWLRICLPMQGTRVWALVWEDPTCRGATRPMSHSYWACASGTCPPQQERPWQWEARAPRWRVAPTRCN